VKRKDFHALTALRLKEAKVLLAGGCPDGAYYLAGYAAESALKASIAKRTERFEFPDLDRAKASYAHDFPKLVRTAGLDGALRQALDRSPVFSENWTFVRNWSVDSRYERRTRAEAERLLNALEDPENGVIAWLKLHW
jgi:HEPN domain-containing protein